MKTAATALLFLGVHLSSIAQFNLGFQLSDTIPIKVNGDYLNMPWAGGMNNPQFSPLDLDTTLDEIPDMFVYDRDGGLRKGFVFDFEAGHWRWQPYSERGIPRLVKHGFCLMRDYDGDGKSDIFTSNSDGDKMRVFRNVSDTALNFELIRNPVRYRFGPGATQIGNLPVAYHSVPVIEDINGDGDLDFMAYMRVPGSGLCDAFTLIENQSMEEFGHTDSIKLLVSDKCWGKVTPAGGATIFDWRNWSCDTTCANDGQRHDILPTMGLFDLNGDGALDATVSYAHNPMLIAFYNSGTTENPFMDLSLNDTAFPSSDIPVNVQNLPIPYFLDYDYDGLTDMLVAANHINSKTLDLDTSQATHVDHFYKNHGTFSTPDFKLEKEGYFSAEMIDVGMRSFPAVVDINGDTLPDLIIGRVGFNFLGAQAPATLWYYKNVGTPGHPEFEFVTDDFGGISAHDFAFIHPAFADLDDDEDFDLIVGDELGRLHYFRNTGYPQNAQLTLMESNFENIDVLEEAHPQFFDLNLDGLSDLIVGDAFGRLFYFENSGNASQYNFSSTPTINQMGGIQLYSTLGGKSTPHFSRSIDSTTNLYCLVSTAKGRINVYGPITNFNAAFVLSDSIVLEATETSIAGANFTGDGRHELLIGQRTGGLYFLNRVNDIPAGVEHGSVPKAELHVYPNPTGGVVSIRLKSIGDATVALVNVTDTKGRLLSSREVEPAFGYVSDELDLSRHPSGIYFISIVHNGKVTWAKLVKE